MKKPNCWDCKYQAEIPGDAHIRCAHPENNRLYVKGSHHGIKNGWFFWPLNFDPVWLESCDGFTKKGGDEIEQDKH